MMKTTSLGVFLLFGCMVFADDLYSPDWRYDSGSTFVQWEFLDNSVTPAPDQLYNPGLITPSITVTPTSSVPWAAEWGGRSGAWALSGEIVTKLENYPELNDYKLVQIQLTWTYEHDDMPAGPTVDVGAKLVTGELVDSIILLDSFTDTLEPTGEPGAGEFWYLSTYLFRIVPNPANERIEIAGSIWVDALVIDTICIPEPTTLALLGLGVLLLWKRR